MGNRLMAIWAAIIAFVTGGGTVGGNFLYDQFIDELDERYVTIAAQNLDTSFRIHDELTELDNEIGRRLKVGDDVTDLLVRKAVLEERLKQLEKNQ